MAKKSEKNKNRRESLRKVKECPDKKAKEAKKAKHCLTWKDYGAMFMKLQQDSDEAELKYQKALNESIINNVLDIGYVFRPDEGKLLDYYLRNKIMGETIKFCPIEEVNVYENHPQSLIGKSKVWYFFTRGHSNAIQPGTDVRGRWIWGIMEDVIYQGVKIGVKQVVEYYEADHKSEYKIMEYRLDPAPDDMKAGPWFVCKLYNDVHSGP